jgi:hypothetical protein
MAGGEQMKDIPILMNAPMVLAVLEGRKTQTRRIFAPEKMQIEPHPKGGYYYHTFAQRRGELVHTGQGPFIPQDWLHYCPYGQPGSRLWVRETFHSFEDCSTGEIHTIYRATDGYECKWTPSIHMPRRASRITLEVVAVRVEGLQAITEADARAEGVIAGEHCCNSYKCAFGRLWESVYSPGYWDADPWVWVIEFKKI